MPQISTYYLEQWKEHIESISMKVKKLDLNKENQTAFKDRIKIQGLLDLLNGQIKVKNYTRIKALEQWITRIESVSKKIDKLDLNKENQTSFEEKIKIEAILTLIKEEMQTHLEELEN